MHFLPLLGLHSQTICSQVFDLVSCYQYISSLPPVRLLFFSGSFEATLPASAMARSGQCVAHIELQSSFAILSSVSLTWARYNHKPRSGIHFLCLMSLLSSLNTVCNTIRLGSGQCECAIRLSGSFEASRAFIRSSQRSKSSQYCLFIICPFRHPLRSFLSTSEDHYDLGYILSVVNCIFRSCINA